MKVEFQAVSLMMDPVLASTRLVPPTAVTLGELEGYSTEEVPVG